MTHGPPRLKLFLLEHPVLHVEHGAHVLLQVVVVPVPLVTKWTLNRVVPEHKIIGCFDIRQF